MLIADFFLIVNHVVRERRDQLKKKKGKGKQSSLLSPTDLTDGFQMDTLCVHHILAGALDHEAVGILEHEPKLPL